MLTLYKPSIDDLWFRQQMLEDPDTMSYNRTWGGTIPFPKEKWHSWHDRWLCGPDGKRFYRYLKDDETGSFVGEIAYHWDEEECICLADVIVFAPCRGEGCGREGLRLLCESARKNGIDVLYDDIAKDNPAIRLFLSEGFEIEAEKEMTFLLKKKLK